MAPNASYSHSFAISNFCETNDCQYQNNIKTKDERRRCKSRNILQHEVFPVSPCVKQVNKASTTYRDNYYLKKCVPKPQKICLPHSAILFTEDRISTVTTYKNDYHYPYRNTIKGQEQKKGGAITQRHVLNCSKEKFTGKSETKLAFGWPKTASKIKFVRNAISPRKGINLLGGKETFATCTTYSSEFKKPRKYLETVNFAPKSTFTVSKEPFKHISQYKNGFKVPVIKRNTSNCSFKKRIYKPPSVPMEKMTTYNSSFTFKVPPNLPQVNRNRDPNYACQECMKSKRIKKSDYQSNISNLGDGDKVNQRKKLDHCNSSRHETSDCNMHINMHFDDKMCDDRLELNRGYCM